MERPSLYFGISLCVLLQMIVLTASRESLHTLAAAGTSLKHQKKATQHEYVNQSCPTWFIPETRNETGVARKCECGNSLSGVIDCNPQTNRSRILGCHCMTYDRANTQLIVGSCYYTCSNNIQPYWELPTQPSKVNEAICEFFNRKGQLCGECKTNYSQPVYSYSMRCVECPEDGTWYRLMKYLAVAFLPLTVFLLVVVALRLNVASGRLNAFVMLCQLGVIAPQMRMLVASQQHKHWLGKSGEVTFFNLVLTTYGIWNLDFFRLFYSPFCIHPGMSTLSVIALDYVIAVYPLVLIAVIYVLVELHDRYLRLLVWLWNPFRRCLAHFRRQWDIRKSLLDAFVTFFLLASVKFLNVTIDLLIPITVYNVYGNRLNTLYLFADGSTEYFCEDHIPYAILAVAVLLVFIILPIVLLLVYPCRCFQRCLNHCRLRCQTLHMVMDVFQGCYKNGTNGTRDCRYFAAVYPILRLTICVLYAATRSPYVYPIEVAVLIITSMAVTALKPYKTSCYNFFDLMILLISALIYTFVHATITTYLSPHFTKVSQIMTTLSITVPLFYGTCLIIYWLTCIKRLPQAFVQWLNSVLWFCNTCRCRKPANEVESLHFPHRLLHAEDYNRGADADSVHEEGGGEGGGGGERESDGGHPERVEQEGSTDSTHLLALNSQEQRTSYGGV